MDLLYDADLITSGLDDGSRGPLQGGTWYFKKLTWRGHDFLDAVREPKTWTRTKEGASRLGSWTVDTLLGIAKAYAKAEAKAKLGIDFE